MSCYMQDPCSMLAMMFSADWHMKNRRDDKVVLHWACTSLFRRNLIALRIRTHVLPCYSQVSLPGSAAVRPSSPKACAALTNAALCRGVSSSTGIRSTLG